MSERPSGTVTFLFTDIEGSTELVRRLRERYADVLALHQRLLRDAFVEAGGQEIDTQGDSFFVVFPRPQDAVLAATAAQRALSEQDWPDGVEVRVRMGIPAGAASIAADRYLGLSVHRAARTKKFCEHMARVLLPDTPKTIFRPSIVLGDSRRAETTQFDMVQAFVFLAGLPALPFRPNDKIDIVNVDFVADAIATLHQKEQPKWDTYHLSSGTSSQTFRELTTALAAAQQKRKPVFLPFTEKPFTRSVNMLSNRKGPLGYGASLMKVFMPYLVWNTVFDNTRVTSELGRGPVPFSQYSLPLLKFSQENNFQYSYQPWPAARAGAA